MYVQLSVRRAKSKVSMIQIFGRNYVLVKNIRAHNSSRNYCTTSAVPVEHETLKLGRDGTTDNTGCQMTDNAGRTDMKVEIFM